MATVIFSMLLTMLLIIGTAMAILIWLHNNLVSKKHQVDKAFSSIDVLLKKRCDLIPNLVAVVKKYAQFEQQTLTEIANLRSKAMSGQATGTTRVELEDRISKAIGNILVALEAYPELKANQNFTQLQYSLTEVEEQISAARRFYNSAVTDYNNAIEMFPSNLIATAMDYRLKKLFEASAANRQNVDVGSLFEQ